nr:MAG TPA: hypothetical protein [Bacteriophage sp.]
MGCFLLSKCYKQKKIVRYHFTDVGKVVAGGTH